MEYIISDECLSNLSKPKKEYRDIVIYGIYNIDEDKIIYIGSTNNFFSRKSHHKLSCKKLKSKVYEYINSSGGWERNTFVILESIKDELSNTDVLTIERKYVDIYEPMCNSYRPIINEEERKILQKECHKKWRESKKA